jgi:hypothetical protein
MGIFSGIEDVKVFEEVPYLKVGPNGESIKYRLRVKSLEAGLTKVQKKEFFRGTFEVISASAEGGNEPGTDVQVYITPRGFEYHIKDIKAMTTAIMNNPNFKGTEAELTALVNPPAKTAGLEVEVEAYQAENKKTGEKKPYTNLRWFKVAGAKTKAA